MLSSKLFTADEGENSETYPNTSVIQTIKPLTGRQERSNVTIIMTLFQLTHNNISIFLDYLLKWIFIYWSFFNTMFIYYKLIFPCWLDYVYSKTVQNFAKCSRILWQSIQQVQKGDRRITMDTTLYRTTQNNNCSKTIYTKYGPNHNHQNENKNRPTVVSLTIRTVRISRVRQ